ncbi:glycosyltransferase [Streptomyces sp. NPDC047315]|uniref:glycosyltransferase family 2 protein n=1 Tax=Streptomyces sp. NPDC047315 TaxID=3155142 RepID=UPI0033CDAA13
MPEISIVVPCFNESEVIETFHTTLVTTLESALTTAASTDSAEPGAKSGAKSGATAASGDVNDAPTDSPTDSPAGVRTSAPAGVRTGVRTGAPAGGPTRAPSAARASFEICYVDDGSADGTRDLLRKLADSDPRARYTSFSRNFGKESAMLAGLRMAHGDAVVIMDADLQHPPSLVPRMLELHRHGYDQVIAQRDRAGEGVLRTALSQAYYRLVRRFMDVEVIDGAGDFRLLSRRAVDALLTLPESNRFSKGLFSWIGFDTVTFDYRNQQRAAGSSKWGGRRLLNYGIDGLLSFNSRPLRLAIHAGLWLVLSALAYAAWIVVNVIVSGVDTPGYATLIAAMVGLGGIQIATLGVIGEYVGRIYHESKRRPHYVVRETDLTGGPPGSVPDSPDSLTGPLLEAASARPRPLHERQP